MSITLTLKRQAIDLAMERKAILAAIFGSVALCALVAEIMTSGGTAFWSRVVHDGAAILFAFNLGAATTYLRVMRRGNL